MNLRANKLNIIVSFIFKIVLIFFNFALRRIFVHYLGIELQGLTSVFTSILGFLGIADLGIGVAINYSMYKPISEGNNKLVGALYGLYKKIYFFIGSIILIGGLVVLPFLKGMCTDFNGDINIYVSYLLSLIAAVISYLYAAESSLIQAHQKNYITILISSGALVIEHIVEIFVLVFFRSYYLYLSCKIVFSGIQYLAYRYYVNANYLEVVIFKKEKVNITILKDIVKNIKALVLHKVGSIVVFNMDSIIISTILGVGMLGYYSNYQTIMTAIVGILSVFFTPITAGVGALIAENNKKTFSFYEFMHQINFALAFICFFVAYTVIDYIITLWLGEAFVINGRIVLIIIINYFVDFMRKSNAIFKDAAGLFYPDRYKCIVEAILNLCLSVYLCRQIGCEGVILATIFTNLFITLVIEPYVVFKYLFKKSPIVFYIRQYLEIVTFAITLIICYRCLDFSTTSFFIAVKNGILGLGVSFIIILVSSLTNKGFITIGKDYFSKIFTKEKQ